MTGLGDRVEAWRALGGAERFRGREIYTQRRVADGPLLLFLHGFPSSSFDFDALLDELGEVNALLFDFLGFGLSEKPREHVYSLLWQADLAEELVARHGDGRPVILVAHDMGTSVATELLARDLAGRLSFECPGALLFNGSMVIEAASLTWVQRLLRSPLGPMAARLSTERLFRSQFAGLFSERHPISAAELDDQWALIRAGGGDRLGDRLIHYIVERERYTGRWHGALRDWPGALALAWGMQDPVATVRVLEAVRGLRPSVPVAELAELGHYPQIESPQAVARALRAQLGPLL